MQLIGLCRLGRDAEVKYTQGGKAVANLSLAFNYGLKDANGKNPSQWIDASLWGDRAEKLSQYLTKGTHLYVILTDPHIETFTKRDGGDGFKLAAMVNVIEFAGSKQEAKQETQAAERPRPSAPETKPSLPGNVQDMDDDIPF